MWTPNGPRPVAQDGDRWVVVSDLYDPDRRLLDEWYPVQGAELLAPCEPYVVMGMAHNSGPGDRALAPQAFSKSTRSVVGPGAPVALSGVDGATAVEGELAVVIGRRARRLTIDEVPDVILGWTIGNDVTAVDQIALDDKMTQAKNGDGFTPIGPWIETDLDPSDVEIVVDVDGVTQARSSTAGLAWNVAEQLVYLTQHLTLGPGDVVLTGAPGTTAAARPGQRARVSIAGIGTLENPTV
ncbi:fumarylacetoacetate hydrolase family protein [Xylanimonas ulmi]